MAPKAHALVRQRHPNARIGELRLDPGRREPRLPPSVQPCGGAARVLPLQHRLHVRHGLVARPFTHEFMAGNQAEQPIPHRGYRFELTPPVEVEVLQGTCAARSGVPRGSSAFCGRGRGRRHPVWRQSSLPMRRRPRCTRGCAGIGRSRRTPRPGSRGGAVAPRADGRSAGSDGAPRRSPVDRPMCLLARPCAGGCDADGRDGVVKRTNIRNERLVALLLFGLLSSTTRSSRCSTRPT